MNKTKIACVYHSIDLDGWMSAAIVKHWFEQEKVRLEGREEVTMDFIGYNYGQSIPDLSEYDRVIMCDISFPKEEMLKLRSNLSNNFIWIDHHISAIKDVEQYNHPDNLFNGLRNTKFAACELTWFYMNNVNKLHFDDRDIETMPEIVRLLGMYDSFRHKTKSFEMNSDGYTKAKQYLEEINKLKEFESNKTSTDGYSLVFYANDVAKKLSEETKVLEFQYGARAYIKNYEDAYEYLLKTIGTGLNSKMTLEFIHTAGKSIYKFLCTDAKQSYKNGFEVKLVENVGMDNGPIRKFICINKERFNPINFGIDYHSEGYDGAMCWHLGADKTVNISFYNDNGQVDCSAIAKIFRGGGHKGAAGCRMDLLQFQELIF